MRDYLAQKSSDFLVNNIKDTTFLSEILSKKKKSEYKELNQEDLRGIFTYAFQALYGETIKTIIIFAIAYMLNILLPVVLITLVFATLRTVAGGVHMDSFMKCLVSSAVLFLVPGYLVNELNNIVFDNLWLFIVIFYTTISCIELAFEYAPRDTETKIISDPEEIKKYKDNTVKYLYRITGALAVLYVVNFLNLYNTQLIILSICMGMLLEIFTITPVGVWVFHGIRDRVNKLHKAGDK